MKTALRAVGILVGLALLALGGLAVAARFSDGPVGVLPGGPLTSGELVEDPVADWSFAADVEEIELQLVEPPRSRTVWIVVHERRAYVLSAFMDLPLWKQWPHEALVDGRALVRIEGRRYEVVLQRVQDPELLAAVARAAAAKYRSVGPPDRVWTFRLDPRTP